MKKLISTLLIVFLFTLTGVRPSQAQDDPPPVFFPDEPDQTPIDGGLIWLLIGGGAYGVKKLREQKKETE